MSTISPINANYFELFSLPVSCQINETALEKAYKKLQAEFHPDRYVDADDRTRLLVLQQSSRVNDAYETLTSPLKRAAYLLKLNDVDAEEHNQSHLNEGFLIQQLELREELENLISKDDLTGLDALKKQVSTDKVNSLESFESFLVSKEFVQAKITYNRLQFLFKLLDEIDKAEEKLLDY